MLNPFDPMPTIKAILGMDIYEATRQSQLLAALDDFEPPRCESRSHDTDADYHSGIAAFYMLSPCHHGESYLCALVTDWAKSQPGFTCHTCGRRVDIAEITFIPLAGQK
jgi:hypothetical protein